MPTYDYRCSGIGKQFDVRHRINEKQHTWAQLCAHASIVLGDTAADSGVGRLVTGGAVVHSRAPDRGAMMAPVAFDGIAMAGLAGRWVLNG